jgi:protein involved in polysaccharide export with SLBB domain
MDERFAELPGPQLAGATNPTKMLSEPQPDEGFRLRPFDGLIVTFANYSEGQPAITLTEWIKEDGTITLLSNRLFTAAGKNAWEMQKQIYDAYAPNCPTNLSVQVWMSEDRYFRFFWIDGGVKSPGHQLVHAMIPLPKAIESAGGFTAAANRRKVKLLRAGHEEIIDCTRAANQDVPVIAGDRIHVSRSFWKW